MLRIYLLIGMVALLMLGALAATSTDGMIARFGAERWRRLHLLVYPIAILGLAHCFMQSKQDVSAPTALSGVFLLGLMRVARRFRRAAHAARRARPRDRRDGLQRRLPEAIYIAVKFSAP